MRKVLISSILSASMLLAGTTTALADKSEPGPFDDVSNGSWYAPYVYILYQNHLVAGIDEDHFGPSMPLTRAQMVVFLEKDADAQTLESYRERHIFSDVKPESWYAPYIHYAYEHGLASGYSDGTFDPNRPVSRAEAAVFLNSYMTQHPEVTLDPSESVSVPTDQDQIPSWAASGVDQCLKYGLFQGYPDGSFQPNRSITRAEISAVLCHLYGLMPEEEATEEEESGIAEYNWNLFGNEIHVVSFDPADGYHGDIFLANEQFYTSATAEEILAGNESEVAVNGTYFNNGGDLGILSSFVRHGKPLRIDNSHSEYKPYFIMASNGIASIESMKIVQNVALIRQGLPVPDATLEEVGLNYKLSDDDGTRMIYTKEFGDTTPGAVRMAVVCDHDGVVQKVVDAYYGEVVSIPEDGFLLCEKKRRDEEYTTKWETFFEEVAVGDTVQVSVYYEGASTQDIDMAFSCGPTVVKDGKAYGNSSTYKQEGFTEARVLYGLTKRIGIGIKKDGSILIVTVHNATLFGLSQIMTVLGCQDAMNLDGGASTALYVDGEARIVPERKLTHMIAFLR